MNNDDDMVIRPEEGPLAGQEIRITGGSYVDAEGELIGLCPMCRHTKGRCPNEYIEEEDSDAFICVWFEPKTAG